MAFCNFTQELIGLEVYMRRSFKAHFTAQTNYILTEVDQEAISLVAKYFRLLSENAWPCEDSKLPPALGHCRNMRAADPNRD